MKLAIILSLLISTSAFAGKKKCNDMYEMAQHTLKMAKLDAETTNEFKVYVRDLYIELENEDRDSDSFAQMKTNLCDGVVSTKEHWNEAHKELASYSLQLQEMINYRGCKKRKEEFKSALAGVRKGVLESKATLRDFEEFYNFNPDPDLNCL